VKYGREAEIHAEVAATHLLSALGYAADRVYMVPSLRCYGCPSNPYLVMRALDLLGMQRFRPGAAGGFLSDPADYADFEWVAVERKFEGIPIEDHDRKGWAWWPYSSHTGTTRRRISGSSAWMRHRTQPISRAPSRC
jgi:hypothetical protein